MNALDSAASDFEVLFENRHDDESGGVGEVLLDVGNVIEIDRGEQNQKPNGFRGGCFGHTSRENLIAVS
jgi:hypothetical protein